MGSVVFTNVGSLNSQRSLADTQRSLATSMERLSSGLRLNSASDDAAGLAIAERFAAQSRGMEMAQRNAADGISMAQTAEGGMQEIGDMLLRMRDLAVQSANGTYTEDDRTNLNNEFRALASEITRTMSTTEFNGRKILNATSTINLQIGANTSGTNQIAVKFTNLSTVDGLKDVLDAKFSVGGSNATAALKALGTLDTAIDSITTERANLGTMMNRFEHTISNLATARENSEASRSRIQDTDFAKETANLARSQILQQAATSMLTQANQSPNTVLGLLR